MTAAPFISILVPVYNSEPWLERCLDSLRGQTLGDVEIIVVNDGSPGNCAEIVERCAVRDPRIVYMEHERNRGAMQARFTGIGAARGEYVLFVDSDDVLAEDTCMAVMDAARKTGADIVGFPHLIAGEGVEDLSRQGIAYGTVIRGDAVKEAFFSRKMNWGLWGKAFKRSLPQGLLRIDRFSGLRLNLHEDLVQVLPMIMRAASYAGAEGGRYHYFRRKGSLSFDPSPADSEAWLAFCREAAESFSHCREYLKENGMSRYLPDFEKLILHQFFRLFGGVRICPPSENAVRARALFDGFDQALLAGKLRPGHFRYLCLGAEAEPVKSRFVRRAGIILDPLPGRTFSFPEGAIPGWPETVEKTIFLTHLPVKDLPPAVARAAVFLPGQPVTARWRALQEVAALHELDFCLIVDGGGVTTPWDILALRPTPCRCFVLEQRRLAGREDACAPVRREARDLAYPLADAVIRPDTPPRIDPAREGA